MSTTSIIAPESWTETLPLDEIFDDSKPLEIDVGCGKGRFLIARAKANPDTNFLGIDRQLGRLKKIDKRALRENITNIKLLRIEASYAVENMLPPDSISTFYVFFSDPWPKRRHASRRLFNEPFLGIMHKKLKAGGQIHAATDNLDYFEIIFDLFKKDKRFSQEETFVPSEEERTNFEVLFLGKNAEIGRCSFKKE